LTPFCTELTKITQDKVDAGIALEEAIPKVHEFLAKNGLFKSEFIFMSCGDFDGHKIRAEALHKNIKLPNYLKRWINLKRVFPLHLFDKKEEEVKVSFIKDQTGPCKVKGMEHMLGLVGLELEGTHHSGIDDSKNIARVALKVLETGYVFHQGMVLSHPFSSGM